jgi:polysaccharide export outer membrane protein
MVGSERVWFFAAPWILMVCAGGCAAERPFVWATDTPLEQVEPQNLIRPRDTLLVTVRDQPPLSGEFVVREDGSYPEPMLGNVAVAGQTPAEVEAHLREGLKTMIVKPEVTVSLSRRGPVRINVVGEVRTPGSYELTRDRSIAAALAAAGWLTDFAAKDRIFVVRPSAQGQRIRFRLSEITTAEPHSASFRLHDEDVVVVE